MNKKDSISIHGRYGMADHKRNTIPELGEALFVPHFFFSTRSGAEMSGKALAAGGWNNECLRPLQE